MIPDSAAPGAQDSAALERGAAAPSDGRRLVMPSISIPLSIIATVVVFYVLAVGKDLLVPLAVAIIIWYVINALSRSFARLLFKSREHTNWLTLAASLLAIALAVGLVTQMIQDNITQVSDAAPGYKENLDRLMTKVSGWVGADKVPSLSQLVDSIQVGPVITKLAGAVTTIIGNVGLIAIYVAFLLVEQNTFSRKIGHLFSNDKQRQAAHVLIQDIQRQVESYISVKTLLSLATGVFGYVVLALVGVDYAAFWAFTIFLLNYVPTIGSIIATVFPALLTLIQFDTLTPFLIVAVGLTTVQFLVGNVVEPKLLGNALNLSPLVVLLSLALWGSVWGVVGMFLCVPITVMALIILSHFEATRPIAVLLSASGDLKRGDEPA